MTFDRFSNALATGALLLLTAGCAAPRTQLPVPGGGPPAEPPPIAEVRGNPFAGVELFNPPYTNADQARRRLLRDNPAEAQLIAKIADTPQARWFGEWSGDIETVVGNYIKAAHNKGKVGLVVAYNIPNRDCGNYSAGGAVGPQAYHRWIDGLAAGIGHHRRAIVVLEPDALPHLKECLSEEDQKARLGMLSYGVTTLSALPGVSVYLDAGHSRWVPAPEMAQRLQAAGLEHARGFALNTSNYIGDDELIQYGLEIVGQSQAPTHFVIDSSRNGNGPAEGDQWCNPTGRALGRPPSIPVKEGPLDAFAWLKSPGESDGTCEGGPKAGQWFHERAVEMARNASW